ncbi:glycosyltransferase family 2 protein [Chloroflexota bacterium]
MKENPLVSIITPVKNGIKYLETCLQSVLNQSYDNIEHIFVDGGSTDGSLEMLASYQSKYPDRIRFISEPDKGVGEAVNKGLKLAKGDIFGWIDSDDVYEPDAIKTVVEFFQANPDACFVFGNCNMLNEKGEVIACFRIKDFDLQEALNDRHYLVFCATFYKREVIERVGGLNALGNDLDFWLRIAKVFELHRIDKMLANWRLHGDSISTRQEEREDKIRKERYRQDYFVSLRHGGSIFSLRSMRYYAMALAPIIQGLRPVLGRYYPFINKVLGR